MKKLCLLIALCAFNYAIKGAAADQKITGDYIAYGYQEEKTFYEQIMKEYEKEMKNPASFHKAIASSDSTQLIELMKRYTKLLEATSHFLAYGKNSALKSIISNHFGLILGTNQIKSALLEGNRELLEILERIERLNIGRVVPLSPASIFISPTITPSEPIDPSVQQLMYFSASSQQESRYCATVSPREEAPHSYVLIHNARTHELVYEVRMQHDEQKINFCCFSPDEENVVINVGNILTVIHIASGTVLREINEVELFFTHVTKSPTEKFIAVSLGDSDDEKVIIFDTATGKTVCETHRQDIRHCQFSPDEKFFLFSSGDGSVTLTSLDSNETIIITQHSKGIETCMFSADGKSIVSQSAFMATVHDTATKKEHYRTHNGASIKDAGISADGKRLSVQFEKYTESEADFILIIDIPRGREIRTYTISDRTKSVLSPDGKLLAIMADDDRMTKTDIQIQVIDSKKTLCTATVKGRGWDSKKSHFSADGRTLVVTKPSPGYFHLTVPPVAEYDSQRQQLLLNALEYKRKTGCTVVTLTPELMECLAVLPSTCRPLLTRKDACTVVLTTNTNPCLTPAAIDEVNCPICCQELTTRVVDGEDMGEQVFTPCGHSYHKACITQALEVKKSCPTCRTPGLTHINITSTKTISTHFPKLETTIRTNPFITLQKDARRATTRFEESFATLPPALKQQLQTLQHELQQAVETSFAVPLAIEPQAAAASAADEESVTSATTSTETVPAAATAQETKEQRRERLAAATLARLELQKESQ